MAKSAELIKMQESINKTYSKSEKYAIFYFLTNEKDISASDIKSSLNYSKYAMSIEQKVFAPGITKSIFSVANSREPIRYMLDLLLSKGPKNIYSIHYMSCDYLNLVTPTEYSEKIPQDLWESENMNKILEYIGF